MPPPASGNGVYVFNCTRCSVLVAPSMRVATAIIRYRVLSSTNAPALSASYPGQVVVTAASQWTVRSRVACNNAPFRVLGTVQLFSGANLLCDVVVANGGSLTIVPDSSASITSLTVGPLHCLGGLRASL